MTYSHGLDFEICEAVLRRGDFAYLGLIGSRSKRARFEHGWRELGLDDALIARLVCPIGGPLRDKRPPVIAALAAAEVLHALAAAGGERRAEDERGGSSMSQETRPASPPRLELRGITKRFPGVVANDHVSFAVAPGEIHALLGENGAGKSTLVKIIYGVLHADEGTVLWQGAPVRIADPHAARSLGIGMVFQHFSLFEAMTVLENIALGVDDATDMRALASQILEVSHAYGLPLDPAREVHTLSVGERQRIEIVRCLLAEPEAPDHGRADLGPDAAGGRAPVRDAAPARRGGGLDPLHQPQARGDQGALRHRDDPARRQGGRDLRSQGRDRQEHGAADDRRPRSGRSRGAGGERGGAPRLTVRNLDLPAAGPFGTTLKDISFEVRRGEIFGIAGVAGNGQNELFQAISGERLAAGPAMVRIDEREVGRVGAGGRRRLGLCCVPEERNGHGAVPDMSLVENAVLSGRHRMGLAASGFIRSQAAASFAATDHPRVRRQDAGR